MQVPIKLCAILGVAILPLAACSQAPAPTNNASDNSSGSVIRETQASAVEEPPVTALQAPAVIQSQPGPDGSQLDLLKVAVTGDILTVTLRCSSTEKYNSESFSLKDISVIDDATAQRIAVLKDNDGNWLASNVTGNGIMTDCTVKPGIIWAKFAAPSASAKTVSINLPKVAPFDGVPIAR